MGNRELAVADLQRFLEIAPSEQWKDAAKKLLLLFESLTAELSSGGNKPNSEYPQSQARELFNANWAAASVFDVNPDFSKSYTQALLIGIHRDN